MKKVIFIMCIILSFCISYLGKTNIGFGITFATIALVLFGIYKKYKLNDIIDAGWINGKKSLLVIQIFILVGAISAAWITSGTIPGIVYRGIEMMDPCFYYVLTFVITSFVAFLIGSSFGTVSTVGIALIAVGRGLNIDVGIAGGAIISGAYFGDRCSPVSSSASLVATLTETDLYNNIKNMFISSIIPFLISCVLYILISKDPTSSTGVDPLSKDISDNFYIGWAIFIPVATILICALFKIKVKISMTLSIVLAVVVALVFQHYNFATIIKSIFLGFSLKKDIPLKSIIKGGGIISMWKSAFIVFTSCFLSGIANNIRFLDPIKNFVEKAKSKVSLFFYVILISIIASMIGCNQSIATVMTSDIIKGIYEKKNISKNILALHIENSAIVIAALIPWNIAGFIPATAMMDLGTFRYIPYSFYLYLIPLCTLLTIFLKQNKKI